MDTTIFMVLGLVVGGIIAVFIHSDASPESKDNPRIESKPQRISYHEHENINDAYISNRGVTHKVTPSSGGAGGSGVPVYVNKKDEMPEDIL